MLPHTGELEVFHSALLKYMPKRQHFSYMGMKERAHLAVMEHNENIVKRSQATTSTGMFREQMYLNVCYTCSIFSMVKFSKLHSPLFQVHYVTGGYAAGARENGFWKRSSQLTPPTLETGSWSLSLSVVWTQLWSTRLRHPHLTSLNLLCHPILLRRLHLHSRNCWTGVWVGYNR